MYGTGSQITSVIQIRDRFLDRKFWHQSSFSGQFSAVHQHLSFVETVFNQLPTTNVKSTFNRFFSTMQDLTTRAHESTFRTNVTTNAHTLTEQIRQNAVALQRQQQDLNREFADVVVTINSLGSQISDLNRQIHIFERNGDNANDLRDQRALLIDRLSELVNIQVEERDYSRPGVSYDRRLSIMINGNDFIDHTRVNRLELVARDNLDDTRAGTKRNEMDVHGLYEVFFELTGSRFNIHSHTLSGQLRGIVDVRDGNGGQITAQDQLSGMLMIQNQLNSLQRSQDFLDSLSSQFGTMINGAAGPPIVPSLSDWVALRDTSLAALGGAANTADARTFVNGLVSNRATLAGALPAHRNTIISGVGATALRTTISAAITMADNPNVNTALTALQNHMNSVSVISTIGTPAAPGLDAFETRLAELLQDLVDVLQPFDVTGGALDGHAIFGTLNGLIADLNTTPPTLTAPLRTAINDITAADAVITAANTNMTNLNNAMRHINDILNFGSRIDAQMEWAVQNANEMVHAVQERIRELNAGTNRIPGLVEQYEDFMVVLQAQLAVMQAQLTAMRSAPDATVPPPPNGAYADLAGAGGLTEFTDAINAIVGNTGTFPTSIQAIIASANAELSAGERRNDGVTTNFKGIPFYMNQLNHLVRTFSRAMNEGRNVDGFEIPDTIGHVFGFDANGENRGALFFTFEDEFGNPGVLVNQDDPLRGLRLWVLADANGEPMRDPITNQLVTVSDPNPPVDMNGDSLVARDEMGRLIFTIDYSQFNALNFMVNPELKDDPKLLAASSNQNIGQANNDVILGFLAVGEDTSIFREGKLIDFIIATSNHLAVDASQARNFRESYNEVTMQTHNHRLSVKSVDTEEEMMNLIRFQNMFIASSKLINVMDTVYDTLINRLGNF
jgi:flagellar hook-associated protein FlgK